MSITRSVTRGVTRPVTRGIGEHFFGDSTEMTLRYDFANKPSLDALVGPTLSITRASTATVTDYDNVLRTVQAAEARFSQGRRVENLCLQSNDFSTSWSVLRSSINTNTSATTDPLGTNTADEYVIDATADTTHKLYSADFTPKIGAVYTISVYAKKGIVDWIQLAFEATGFPAAASCEFDLTNGVAGSVGSGGDSAAIEDTGDGWYRCSLTATADAVTGTGFFVNLAEAESDVIFNGTPNGTDSLYIYGAQIENVSGQDDPSPSEYQATTTAAVSKWYATKRRTNLCLQSEDFGNASWADFSGGPTKSANAAVAPDGATTADELAYIDSVNDSIAQGISLSLSTAYTLSLYVKNVDADRSRIRIYDNGVATDADLRFAWTGGVPSTQSASADVNNETYTDVGNGWYRISFDFTSDSVTTGHQFRIYPEALTAATQSIYVWGAQLEKGSTATAYIATTTTVASSAVDTAITATGLLVEEARTNICLQSEDLSTTWLPISPALVTADQATAPDGTLTADKLGDDSSTGTGACRLAQNLTIATATTFTYSVYLKQDGLSWGNITILSLGALSIYAYFDLVNGVVGATTGANNTSEFIEDVGNGWYRCGIVFESDASDAAGSVNVYPADGNGDNVVDLDGTSSIFVWGAQLEAGAFPTSYIPTTTVSVTRAADDINTTDVGWLNANEGTLHVNATKKAVVSQVAAMVTINDGGATDQIFLDVASNDTRAAVTNSVGNGDLVVFTSNKWASNLTSDIAFAWAQDDVAVYQDGDAATPGTSVDLPLADAAIQLDVGQRDGDLFWNGHIAEIRYYNSRLDNAALLNMSNGIFP